MAKCKYPNEVCANMTILNGSAYCDSIPCSLKNELPKQTNADRIRSMSDEELAELFAEKCKVGKEFSMCWLQSEVKGSE